jgi:hypothetical protein
VEIVVVAVAAAVGEQLAFIGTGVEEISCEISREVTFGTLALVQRLKANISC